MLRLLGRRMSLRHEGVVARSREYLEVDLARIAVDSGATDVS